MVLWLTLFFSHTVLTHIDTVSLNVYFSAPVQHNAIVHTCMFPVLVHYNIVVNPRQTHVPGTGTLQYRG